MSRARITLDRDFTVGDVPRRIFGSFVEHMGRCVYTGIYEPGHPDGRRAGLPPGRPRPGQGARRRPSSATPAATSSPGTTGRTASARGTGRGGSTAPGTPSRPTRSGCTSSSTGPAWPASRSWRPSTWAPAASRRRARSSSTPTTPAAPSCPTGGARTATRTRSTSGCGAWATRWTARGRSGAKTADEYGRLAQEAAKAMRLVDPTDRAGRRAAPRTRGMPTFGAWEQTVLGHTYDEVDYVSLHAYYQEHDGDAAQLPGQRGRHGLLHRVGGRHRRRRPGRRASTRSTSTSPSTSGTSGSQPARTPRTSRT